MTLPRSGDTGPVRRTQDGRTGHPAGMEHERRTRPVAPAVTPGTTGQALDLTATRRREDLVLAVADVLLACADRSGDPR